MLLAYIDNFRLLNWTFHHHGGAMFLRGSCQEVAGGSSFDDAAMVGSRGVRHVGNLPKAECARAQPANVWVHHNSIVSGDGAYQACQPLDTSLWINAGSDDMLWEGNTGGSVASAFILVGLSHVQPQHSAFACTNITFRDMHGSGFRLIYVQAAAQPNVVERIVLCVRALACPPRLLKCADFSPHNPSPLPRRSQNLVINSTDMGPYWPAAIQVSALHGGVVRSVLMDGVRALGTPKCGLNETGQLEGVVFTNGYIAAPTVGGTPTVDIGGGVAAELSNSFIGGGPNGNNVNVGAAGVPTQGTRVVNCTLAGVSASSVGVALGSSSGSVVLGNRFGAAQGAPNTTGIALDVSGDGATTGATAHLNDVREMAVGVICGRGAGNNVTGNPGAKDC